ncbi:hypothetical protein GCM10008959_23760 [Deinococcus seoulensis]|uniref:Uncharacterized protein n=1 Tax=Deinococcus seoulensis TaxID=1837379 RepID=A0ABQ2RVJ0_9DEIO|nr:hypothetical protein GCM10008959_23760 [Deinococcus seoulensis]
MALAIRDSTGLSAKQTAVRMRDWPDPSGRSPLGPIRPGHGPDKAVDARFPETYPGAMGAVRVTPGDRERMGPPELQAPVRILPFHSKPANRFTGIMLSA